MDLHRISGRPEWANVTAARWNRWQRLAARTHGIVTIGNFFSLLGLASVPVGLWLILGRHVYFWGAFVLAVGRLGDLLDGWLADKTGTKSPLGEMVDAGFDKISIVVTVVALLVGRVIPWWVLVIWLAPHAVNSVFALLAWQQNRRLHPSRAGKNSTATGWAAILVFVATTTRPNIAGSVLGFLLLVLTAVLGGVASAQYVREYFKRAG